MRKKFTVGFCKKLYQYFNNIEAGSEEEAVIIAEKQLKDEDWSDYENQLELCDCYEDYQKEGL